MSNFLSELKSWVKGEKLMGLDNTDNMVYHEPEVVQVSPHHENTITERIRYWMRHNEKNSFDFIRTLSSILFAIIIIVCLLVTVADLPKFGDASDPVNNEVSQRYIEKGLEETGGINIVGGMILDYRAFDTLGESHVLFIAVSAVIILLRNDRKKKGKNPEDLIYEPRKDLILQKISKIIIPFILMFGIYVLLNGHLGPGGGFSGGTVMGAALILYYNAFGTEAIGRFFTYKTFNRVAIPSLAFYAFAKCYSFFTGANHLNSHIPLGKPGAILSSGLILPLNIAVGIVVMCTMFGFYSLFNREEI